MARARHRGSSPRPPPPTQSPVVQHGCVHGLGGHREEPQQPLLPGLQRFLQERQAQGSGRLWHPSQDVQAPHIHDSLWSPKPWVQMWPLIHYMRLLNRFQGYQALRHIHTFESLSLWPGELLHILQYPPSLPLSLPPSRRTLAQPWVLHSDLTSLYPALSAPSHHVHWVTGLPSLRP